MKCRVYATAKLKTGEIIVEAKNYSDARDKVWDMLNGQILMMGPFHIDDLETDIEHDE